MKILVFADIHGNATALKAILNQEREFDSVIFLGDAVSPGPQPNETTELLSGLKGIFIRGNHEFVMLNPHVTANWPDGYKALIDWTFDTFEPRGYQLLRSFKKGGEFEVDRQKLVLAHGDENENARHVLPDMPDELFKPIACGSQRSPVLFGHSHIQFRQMVGSQEFINPGSVGQNRCGHVTACYGLLIEGVYSHQHVDYDPRPWLDAVDRIEPLKEHLTFREAFKQQVLTGFSVGQRTPWSELAKLGYR